MMDELEYQRRPVTYVRIERLTAHVERHDLFRLRADRKHVWLQRLCFWVLDKIGAYSPDVIKSFIRHPQENDDLLRALLTQEEWIFRALHENREKYRVYCGPHEATGLYALVNHMGFSPVTLNAQIDTCTGPSDLKFHNIPIIVIPWMDGILIAPSEK